MKLYLIEWLKKDGKLWKWRMFGGIVYTTERQARSMLRQYTRNTGGHYRIVTLEMNHVQPLV